MCLTIYIHIMSASIVINIKFIVVLILIKLPINRKTTETSISAATKSFIYIDLTIKSKNLHPNH